MKRFDDMRATVRKWFETWFPSPSRRRLEGHISWLREQNYELKQELEATRQWLYEAHDYAAMLRENGEQ